MGDAASNDRGLGTGQIGSGASRRRATRIAGAKAVCDGGASGGRLLAERSLDASDEPSAPVAADRGRRPRRSVIVNEAESPLGWLFARGHVTPRQMAAGERLRADFERSGLAPRTTMSWAGTPVGRGSGASGAASATERQIDARARFHAALEAAGPGLGDILWRVVCVGDGMREAEGALGWPARAGKLVLSLGLDRLAGHYRIA